MIRSLAAARPDGIVHEATALTGLREFRHFGRSFAEDAFGLAARRQPLGQEVFPGSVANGPVGGEVGAGPDCAGRLAGGPDWHDQPVPVTGPQVAAEQLFQLVHAWPGDLGRNAGRVAEGEGWNRTPGTGITGIFAICRATVSIAS